MLRHLCWSVVALVGLFTTAAAQETPTVAGTWNGKSMVGPRDSVVTSYVLVITTDGKSSTMAFPNRNPLPARILDMGGDSVVTEVGPYLSILRPGQTVKTLRTVAHVTGNILTGTFETRYENGDVLTGKTTATRSK